MTFEVRSVNGYGPRCGCGGKSALHLRKSREITPETSIFLCARCVEAAIRVSRFDKRPYWPGDEDRDEFYQLPAELVRSGAQERLPAEDAETELFSERD